MGNVEAVSGLSAAGAHPPGDDGGKAEGEERVGGGLRDGTNLCLTAIEARLNGLSVDGDVVEEGEESRIGGEISVETNGGSAEADVEAGDGENGGAIVGGERAKADGGGAIQGDDRIAGEADGGEVLAIGRVDAREGKRAAIELEGAGG